MKRMLLMGLLVAGCTTDPVDQKFATAWPDLNGEPITRLVSRWGPPQSTSEARDDAGPVYLWFNKGQYGNNTQVCRIAVLVGPQNRIRSIKLGGNQAACRYFADLL
jgi:hypothetical protein